MTDIFALDEVARLPAAGDNAAIATRRLARGTRICFENREFTLDHDVLEGHRFAVRDIAPGASLLSWGFRFGIAARPIAPGNYVVNDIVLASLGARNISLDLPPEPNFRNQIDPFQFDAASFTPGEQVPLYAQERTFMGYRRNAWRGVGTRNVIVVMGLSSRAASYARALAIRCERVRGERIRQEMGGFENVDGIAAVAHTEGSGRDPINNYELLVRTLAGMMVNPNVGAVLAVSHPEDAVTDKDVRDYLAAHEYPIEDVPHAWLTLTNDPDADLERGKEIVLGWLPEVNSTARTPQSLAHLKLGLQCGGSDAFSGVSGNPLLGAVAREVVKYGGSANLAETDELITAESYVLKSVRDLETAQEFLAMIERFKAQLAWHGVSPEGNPSGGNQYRGLYNISLKSLGAAQKKDPAVRLDYVIDYGEPMPDPGFYFMNSPGNDLESIAGQMASGCNMIFFVTGNGSVTNFPFVPTIKIVTTTGRYNLLANEMDVNAGAYLDGTPFDELTQETVDLTVRIASGELSKGERAAHSQVSIWRNWRQTDARQVNVILEMPAPDGEPIALRASEMPTRPLGIGVGERERLHTSIGLILPTSLCSGEVARLTADSLNREGMLQERGIARYATLVHTEGCGVSGDSYMALYKRTMVNYMLHPMVRYGLFLEHGCEMTHNDAMRVRLKEAGGDPTRFGWASIQLDGGIEKVSHKIHEWFRARLDEPHSHINGHAGLPRIGMAAMGTPPPQIAAALAGLARAWVENGGTVVVPSNTPLLRAEEFQSDLLNGQTPPPSLAYGQAASKQGFHTMDAPSQHWVETLSGLGATGVEIVLVYVERYPVQGHPFIPVLQFTERNADERERAPDVDLALTGTADECERELEQAMYRMLAGEIMPRAERQENQDFQITRSLLGVSV